MVSQVIPSRWAFEANLLQEAKADEWKPAIPAPTRSTGKFKPEIAPWR